LGFIAENLARLGITPAHEQGRARGGDCFEVPVITRVAECAEAAHRDPERGRRRAAQAALDQPARQFLGEHALGIVVRVRLHPVVIAVDGREGERRHAGAHRLGESRRETQIQERPSVGPPPVQRQDHGKSSGRNTFGRDEHELHVLAARRRVHPLHRHRLSQWRRRRRRRNRRRAGRGMRRRAGAAGYQQPRASGQQTAPGNP
jgi:hypothetical protein